jgi:phosphate transport system protein
VTVSYSYNNSAFASSQFQRKIRELEQDVLRMGALVENSCRLAHEALFARNLSAIDNIVNLDKEIDKFYRQIDVDSAQLMAIASPVAQDLRLLNAFIQMVRDLERIGDYAEDLAGIAFKLFPYPVHACMPQMEEMSNNTRAMLAKSLIAVSNLDGEAQKSIEQLDDEVDAAYEQIYHSLAFQRDVPGILEPVLLLALSIRHLERMADHANNVARRVSYVVTGQHP